MKKNYGVIVLFLSLMACGSNPPVATPADQSGLETVVASTITALTANAPVATEVPPTQISETATEAPPTQNSETATSTGNISFVLPKEIGLGINSQLMEVVPPSEDVAEWAIAPAHYEYHIEGYVLQNTLHKPSIYIYPVDEYSQMSEGIATLISNFQTLLNSADNTLPEKLPFLPTFPAAQVFHSNAQKMSFQNGSGIRYITQYDQAPLPINNYEVFYTFQGLSNDGKYYIAAIMPINLAVLVADDNPNSITPPGGIPFDVGTFEFLPAYLNSIKELLNASDPNAFTPSLILLDQLIQSVTIIPQ